MGKANIERGKKWKEIRATCAFQTDQKIADKTKEIEWIDSQESIVNDIKEYEDSIKPKGKKETKSKKEK